MGMTKAQKAEYNAQKASGADKATLRSLQQAFKEERIAENDQIRQLGRAQKAEIYSLQNNLKELGYTPKEIKALISQENKANKAELSSATSTLRGTTGTGFIGIQDAEGNKGPILSKANAYAENPDVLKGVGEDMVNTLNAYTEFGVPMYLKRGDAKIGIGMDSMMKALDQRDPETGAFKQDWIGKFLTKQGSYQGKNLTAEEIMGKPGKKLTQDKTNPDLFYRKAGDNYYYFKKNDDNTYTNIGANRVHIEEDEGLFGQGGFLGLGDILGPMAQIGASIYGGPLVAAGTSALNAATYGADFGDILKAGALSYAGNKLIPDLVTKGLGSDAAISAFGTNLAKVPGVVPGISQAGTNFLSGQSLEDALKSGVIGGVAANVGANVSKATESPVAGQMAGGFTESTLSGAPLSDAALSSVLSGAGTYAYDKASDYIKSNVLPATTNVASAVATKTGMPTEVPSYFSDPKFQTFAKEYGKTLINQGLKKPMNVPSYQASFAPGTVLRKVSAPTDLASIGQSDVAQGKRGGRVKVDVSKLIPINQGSLQHYSR